MVKGKAGVLGIGIGLSYKYRKAVGRVVISMKGYKSRILFLAYLGKDIGNLRDGFKGYWNSK